MSRVVTKSGFAPGVRSGRTNMKQTCGTPVFTRTGTSSSYVDAPTPGAPWRSTSTTAESTVVGLNRAKDVRRAIPLIKARRTLNLEQLRDEHIDPTTRCNRIIRAVADDIEPETGAIRTSTAVSPCVPDWSNVGRRLTAC